MASEELLENLALVAPLVLVWLVLIIAGLADLLPRESTRGPKWAWVLIVTLFSIIGPVVYFLFGREEA